MSAGGAVLLGLKWGAVAMGSLLPLLYCGVFTRLGTFRFMDNRLNGEGNREMMVIFFLFFFLFYFRYFLIIIILFFLKLEVFPFIFDSF